MVFVLLSVCLLFGLELERLTLAATFLFIACILAANPGNSVKLRPVENNETAIPKQSGCLRQAALYTAETLDASTALGVVQFLVHRFGILQVDLFEFAANNAIANLAGSPALL